MYYPSRPSIKNKGTSVQRTHWLRDASKQQCEKIANSWSIPIYKVD